MPEEKKVAKKNRIRDGYGTHITDYIEPKIRRLVYALDSWPSLEIVGSC